VKVAWDARVVYGPELRGMGTYTANLLHAIGTARPGIDRVLLTDESANGRDRISGVTPHVVGPSRGYRWQIWEQVGLPWHAARLGVNLLHSPANTTPRFGIVPRVVTVHDVIPYLPEVAETSLSGRYWLKTVPDAVRTAAAVITDSEASRRDIERVLDVPAERISVIPLAVGRDVEAPAAATARDVLASLGVLQPYVLSLAAPAPRKNTAGVVRVFGRIARACPDVQLVLTGVDSALRRRVLEIAAAERIPESRLRMFEYVDAPTRNALYAGASVFLFLTLYEGFGLPILEAMRCGAPVLCSTRSSCPEVAGDATVLVDPGDEAAAADLLRTMLSASSAQQREWRERGWAREREFTWARTAEMTLSVYDAVAN
jgi:glycosyltransferase involved in cell wall biosynthesis